MVAVVAGVAFELVLAFTPLLDGIPWLLAGVVRLLGIIVVTAVLVRAQITQQRELRARIAARDAKVTRDAALQELAQRLLEATGEEAVHDATLRATQTLAGADHVALFMADAKTGELRLAASLGFQNGAPAQDALAGYAFLMRRTIQVDDVAHETRFAISPSLRERGVQSGIAVPVAVRQEPVGVLAAYYQSARQFDERESGTLGTIAQQTALALEKAHLYSELQDSLQRLQESQAQLIQAEKLKALGTLLSGMAHELNNPLSTIQLSVQLMKRAAGLPDALRRRMDAMEEECDRASRIIRDLLVFARRKPPERRPTDVNEVIRTALALQAPDLDASKIRVGTDLVELPPIMADGHQLQQVLLNLFTNATHAMKEDLGRGALIVRSMRRGGEIIVQVEDDGPGIPVEHLGRIFDPFFTTKGAGEGTGLGLSLSIGIIEAHGGRMAADNIASRGARFTLRLPIGAEGATASATPPANLPAGGRRARVLVVDHEERLRSILTEVLGSLGHQVEQAPNGAVAKEKLGSFRYDLVMLDLRLPDIGGTEVWQWLLQHDSALASRVVFMTGEPMSGPTQGFLADTGRPVLTKPLTIDRVRAVVDEVMSATG